MKAFAHSHFIKLKELVDTDRIATDDWKASEYDALHDLGFELDGLYNMEFEHEETVYGKEKNLELTVYKNDSTWTLEMRGQRTDKKMEKQPTVKREYKEFKNLMRVIHEIFKKF